MPQANAVENACALPGSRPARASLTALPQVLHFACAHLHSYRHLPHLLQDGDSATALNRGFCCRCGSGRKGHHASEGLQTRRTRLGDSATAPNRGVCCRCGRRGERRASERSDYGIPSPGGFAPFGRTSPPAWRRALQKCKKKSCSNEFDSFFFLHFCGEGGIRTPGTVTRTAV